MRHRAIQTIAGLALMGAAPAASGQLAAADYLVYALARDMRPGHPDFTAVPPDAFVRISGLLAPELVGRAPMYAGVGSEVASPATDAAGNLIPPFLAQPAAAGSGDVSVDLVSAPTFSGTAYADSYDSTAGPYDPAAAGPVTFNIGAPMPALTEPALSVPHEPRFYRDRKQTTVLTTDLHVDEFNIRTGHTVEVEGDITILVEKRFELNNQATIEVRPGGSLKLYLKGTARVEQTSGMNQASQDTKAIEIFNLGTDPFVIRNHNMVYARLVSPRAPLEISNNTDFFGRVTAQSIDAANSSAIHIDGVAMPEPEGCLALDDDPAEFGAAHDGAITSSDYFQTWFNTVPGQNMSVARALVMHWDDADSAWRFRSSDFRPVDGALYGSRDPSARNGSFTFVVDASFDFTECDGLFFELACDGDAWVFIDGELVLDLGGLQSDDRQLVELDRLELDPSVFHRMMIFYAHRTEEAADFEIHTNLRLRTYSSRLTAAALSD